MQIVGIFQWKKHLKKETQEIIKTQLNTKEKIFYTVLAIIFSILAGVVLQILKDPTPYIDGTATTLSVIGLILTIKRCIEQWYIWTIVNALSAIMWIVAYINGSNCFATILMWLTYLTLGLYFYTLGKKKLSVRKFRFTRLINICEIFYPTKTCT